MESTALQRWALAAEIVGGIAVVVSLGVVAFQLNQGTEEAVLNRNILEISAYQDLTQSVMDLNTLIITDPNLVNIIATSNTSPGELTNTDLIRLRLLYTNLYRHGNLAYFQFERGTIDEEQLDQVLGVVRGMSGDSPIARSVFDNLESLVNENYVSYINEFMGRSQ